MLCSKTTWFLPERKPLESVCHVTLNNKSTKIINFPASVTNKRSFVTSAVTNDLTVPIRSKIFSFDNFLCELDADQLLADPTVLPCNWVASPFFDKYNDQIVIVDLRIIKNNKFRIILCLGPKYRDIKPSILVPLNNFLWFKSLPFFLVQWQKVCVKNLSQIRNIRWNQWSKNKVS